jgi:hypothetical protein
VHSNVAPSMQQMVPSGAAHSHPSTATPDAMSFRAQSRNGTKTRIVFGAASGAVASGATPFARWATVPASPPASDPAACGGSSTRLALAHPNRSGAATPSQRTREAYRGE